MTRSKAPVAAIIAEKKIDVSMIGAGILEWTTEEPNSHTINSYLQNILNTPNLIVLAGSGASLGKVGGPSMADLWTEASSLPDFADVIALVRHPPETKLIEDFLSRAHLALGFLNGIDFKKVKEYVKAAEKMIVRRCSEFLKHANLDTHKSFLVKMARRRSRAPRLRLFTTNYDLCFEKAASEAGLVVVDGFCFNQPRYFDPRFFEYDIIRRAKGTDETHDFVEGVIHVLKIHGSVNWEDDIDEERIYQRENPDNPCLIYPSIAKYERTYTQPYLEMMAQFQAALRMSNICLVTIGFGFNDNHLTAPILSAVATNPSFKLLVIDPSAEKNSLQSDTPLNKLKASVEKGHSDIVLFNSTFDKFVDYIPQLKALSPSQELEQSIAKMVGRNKQ